MNGASYIMSPPNTTTILIIIIIIIIKTRQKEDRLPSKLFLTITSVQGIIGNV